LVVCNPPYIPHDRSVNDVELPSHIGPPQAWDAGSDGRRVLDPLCANVRQFLVRGGSLLLVQSEFAEPCTTLAALAGSGLDAEILACQWIPFGPILSSRAQWLEHTGRLELGRREEELVVIRADNP
jgi:release factor glutamine methyltransferase